MELNFHWGFWYIPLVYRIYSLLCNQGSFPVVLGGPYMVGGRGLVGWLHARRTPHLFVTKSLVHMLRKLENQTQGSSMLDLWATFLFPPPQLCTLWCDYHSIGELTGVIEREVSFGLLISSPLPLRKSSSESVDFLRKTFHTESKSCICICVPNNGESFVHSYCHLSMLFTASSTHSFLFEIIWKMAFGLVLEGIKHFRFPSSSTQFLL